MNTLPARLTAAQSGFTRISQTLFSLIRRLRDRLNEASLQELPDRLRHDIGETDFRPPEVKEAKQAEFLVFKSLPWELIERVGVQNGKALKQVRAAVAAGAHQPPARVESDWYY